MSSKPNTNKHLYIKIVFLAFVIAVCGCRCLPALKETKAATSPFAEAKAYAEAHLPKRGQLVQQEDGYAYVKVDDRYINELFPMLHASDKFKKPPYFRRKDAPGAHISVFYEGEHVKVQEAGEYFNFSIEDIAVVHPKKNLSFIVMQVKSPELEQLRKKYGLGPKLNGHEFHISIAKSYE